MGQSALPDVNSAFIRYRSEAINGWKNRNYDSAIGSLYSFNGLLEEKGDGKYRVLVDSKEYERKTKQDLVMFCKHCEPDIYENGVSKIDWDKVKTVSFYSVKIEKVVPSLMIRVLSNLEYEETWCCPVCNKDNYLTETIMIQKILKNPSFIAIVPEPPIKNNGIIDRSQYYSKFTVWFWTFLIELEAQAARFRQEYTPKQGSDGEEMLPEDTGEEKDN